MPLEVPENLIHAAFFFIDIVGLSNPTLSTKTQSEKIKALTDMISECKAFRSSPKEEKLVLPTGDGMAIGFINGLEKPLELATELHQKLARYNSDKVDEHVILARVGCHAGNVFFVNDIYGNRNFWGPGIILTRRVMDLGDAGHILMTSSMAESLIELSDYFKKIIHPLHDYEIKHGDVILLYSAYDDAFGNSNRPKKGIKKNEKIFEDVYDLTKPISYENVNFTLKLKDPKISLFEITRKYDIINNSEEPIFEVVNGIITNVEKKFNELKVRVLDENQKELQIIGINVDTTVRKEFRIKLSKPVFKGDSGRKFSVIYEVEEPKNHYENLFLINSNRLCVRFIYPTEEKLNPQLYAIQEKDREKRLLDRHPTKKEGVLTQLEWIKIDGVQEKDLIRLEW